MRRKSEYDLCDGRKTIGVSDETLRICKLIKMIEKKSETK